MIFDLIPLTEEEEEKVLESVGYSRQRLSTDLSILRQWLEQQHHLPPSRLKENDDFLTNFLIGCKGSIERAKKKLDCYYSWRRRSAIFAERDPNSPSLVESHKNTDVSLMPKILPSGYRLSFMRFKSPDGFNMLATFRMMTLMMEMRIRCTGITAGDYVVMDCEGFSSSYLSALSPPLMKDMVLYVQSAIPQRCAQYYLINCSQTVETIFNKMVKPFMSKKMSERFTVTREGRNVVKEKFHLEVIPKDYGGNGPPLDNLQRIYQEAVKALCAEKQEFLSGLQELTDEKKRPAQPRLSSADNTIFGVQGSIKTLTID